MNEKMLDKLNALLDNPNGRNLLRLASEDMANAVSEKRARINRSKAIMLKAESAQADKERFYRRNPAKK